MLRRIVRQSYRGVYYEYILPGDGWLVPLEEPHPQVAPAMPYADKLKLLKVELADLRNRVNEHLDFSKKKNNHAY